MHLRKEELVNPSELGWPPIVYKYRTWKEEFHKTIITKREVYMASPRDFEDPVDCKIPVRWDLLTDMDLFALYYYHSQRKFPYRFNYEHKRYAQYWATFSPLKDPSHIRYELRNYFEELFERLGVLSLTANPFNLKMWNKYADNSKGICVGFDPNVMFRLLGGGGEVSYYDQLPIIYPEPIHSFEKKIGLQVFSKLKKWSFEEEYRTLKYSDDGFVSESRVINIPPEAYREIIIGQNMPKDLKEDLLASIPDELSHIEIKDLSIASTT